MFRATSCSSSGKPIVSIQRLVYFTLCRWPSVTQVTKENIRKNNCASSWSFTRTLLISQNSQGDHSPSKDILPINCLCSKDREHQLLGCIRELTGLPVHIEIGTLATTTEVLSIFTQYLQPNTSMRFETRPQRFPSRYSPVHYSLISHNICCHII
jgi:hypothetical protein